MEYKKKTLPAAPSGGNVQRILLGALLLAMQFYQIKANISNTYCMVFTT